MYGVRQLSNTWLLNPVKPGSCVRVKRRIGSKKKKKKNWMNAGEGINKSVRIRIENRDHTFTVRLNGLCLLSCLLGGLTVLV